MAVSYLDTQLELSFSYTLFLILMRPFFAYRQKKLFHIGVRTGCHYLISPSVCLVSVCFTFVVFNEAFFAFRQNSLFIPGCVQGAII